MTENDQVAVIRELSGSPDTETYPGPPGTFFNHGNLTRLADKTGKAWRIQTCVANAEPLDLSYIELRRISPAEFPVLA